MDAQTDLELPCLHMAYSMIRVRLLQVTGASKGIMTVIESLNVTWSERGRELIYQGVHITRLELIYHGVHISDMS